MTQTTTLSALKKQDAINAPADMRAGFDTVGGFELMQRGAKLLANSTLVPDAYQAVIIKRDKYGNISSKNENPNAISNCVLALNMSQRMGADPLMVMQNLYIVKGRPAWSSQFIIAAINACGKFTPLRFDVEDKGEREMEWTEEVWKKNPNTDKSYREEVEKKAVIHDFACTAWATEKATGTKLSSPTVTVEMAVREGWYGKDGSKWKTMPEVMLRYRAASFFGKIYAPELLMGIATAEEVHDTIDLLEAENGTFGVEEEPRKTMTTADITEAPAQTEAPAPEQRAAEQSEQGKPAGKKRAAPAAKSPAPAASTGPDSPAPQAAAPAAGAAPAGKQPSQSRAEATPPPLTHNPQTGEVFGLAAGLITCPNTGRQVDELDCTAKSCREGCPVFEF